MGAPLAPLVYLPVFTPEGVILKMMSLQRLQHRSSILALFYLDFNARYFSVGSGYLRS
jgi:hypothetical protein